MIGRGSAEGQAMRLCVIGDSFVNGTGDPLGLGWVGRVCAAARRRGHDVTCYNLGIRGDTSADIARRWREEAGLRLPADIDGRLVFSFGANDCRSEAGAPRIERAAALANARVILGTAKAHRPTLMLGPPPIPGDAAADAAVAALSPALARLCGELDVPYLELHRPLSALGLWRVELAAGDGAHPGTAGYALIADLVEGWPAWRQWLP
jgi:acyl-CoA thioesterase I